MSPLPSGTSLGILFGKIPVVGYWTAVERGHLAHVHGANDDDHLYPFSSGCLHFGVFSCLFFILLKRSSWILVFLRLGVQTQRVIGRWSVSIPALGMAFDVSSVFYHCQYVVYLR